MVVVPTKIDVTKPVVSIVATELLDETQGLVGEGAALPVNWVVKPTQTLKFPVMVGNAFTVIVSVILQPFELVYVIVVVPVLTPVTNPELVIVATKGLEETQGFVVAAVGLPVNWVVKPIQTFNVPVMVGNAFTVIVAVLGQPVEVI